MSEVLKLEMNGVGQSFTDSSASAHSVGVTGATFQIPTINSNSTTALWFDGDSDYLDVSTSGGTLTLGSLAFTLEGYFRFETESSDALVTNGVQTSGAWGLINDGTLKWGTNGSWRIDTGFTPLTATTYHIAVCREADSNTRFFINGTQTGSTVSDSTALISTANSIRLGTGYGVYAAAWFDGWMKDIKLSTDALYTSDFTVPTGGLATSGTTQLLLAADAPDGLNSPLGSSAYFAGADDILWAADHADWDFEDGDFTVEGFFKWDSAAAESDRLIGQWDEGGNQRSWMMRQNGTTALEWWYSTNGTAEASFSGAWTDTGRVWNHLAVSRSNGTTYLFANGKLVSSDADANTYHSGSSILTIGADQDFAEDFKGWAKEIRISDTPRYVASFAVPTATFATDANTKLLLHLDGTPGDTDDTNGWLTDETGTHTVAASGDTLCLYTEDYRNRFCPDLSSNGHQARMFGTARIDWIAVEGEASAQFDGGSDNLALLQSEDFTLPSDFTIATWIKWINVSGERGIFKFSEGGPSKGMDCNMHTSGGGRFDYRFGDSTLHTHAPNPALIMNGGWYYVAFVRSASSLWLFLNGRLVETDTDADLVSSSTISFIGQHTNSHYGWMDQFIIDKGTPLYTADFIPPTYSTGAAPTSPTTDTRRVFMIT